MAGCLGLPRGEEVGHAGDHERDPGGLQGTSDGLRVRLHASEQDGHVGPRQTPLDPVLREGDTAQRLNGLDDVPRLGVGVGEEQRHDVAAFGELGSGWPRRLREPSLVLFDERLRGFDDALA